MRRPIYCGCLWGLSCEWATGVSPIACLGLVWSWRFFTLKLCLRWLVYFWPVSSGAQGLSSAWCLCQNPFARCQSRDPEARVWAEVVWSLAWHETFSGLVANRKWYSTSKDYRCCFCSSQRRPLGSSNPRYCSWWEGGPHFYPTLGTSTEWVARCFLDAMKNIRSIQKPWPKALQIGVKTISSFPSFSSLSRSIHLDTICSAFTDAVFVVFIQMGC